MGILGHPCSHCGEKLHDDEVCHCRDPHVHVTHSYPSLSSFDRAYPPPPPTRVEKLLKEVLAELRKLNKTLDKNP